MGSGRRQVIISKRDVSIESFERLEVWQGAHALVLRVYSLTSTMPSDEKFGLVSQMRRTAVSVAANIAEGFKRRSRPDKVHSYNMAQGSLEEVRYYFISCRDLGYRLESESIAKEADRAGRMMHGLIKSVAG